MEENLPYGNEESLSDRFRMAVIIITVCMALLGIYAIYSVFTSGIDWGFDINWNCFKSPFYPILCVIGFFLQFFNWQHSSIETWIGTKEGNSSKIKWEKSNDITDFMFGSCMMPLLSHLVIYPCFIGAAIWYTIMGAVHLLGKMSPFVISALIAVVILLFYRLGNKTGANRYRVAILAILTIVETGILGGTAYFMNNHDNISIFNSLTNNSGITEPIGECHISGNGVNLRVGPGTDFDKSGYSVSEGESYPLLEESDGWAKIDYNGTPLWLSIKFCYLIYNSDNGQGMSDEEDLGCWTGDDDMEDVGNPAISTSGTQEETNIHNGEDNTTVEIINPIPGATALTGKLDGKYEIVLQFVDKGDGTVMGNYYYTKYKTPISLSGEINGTTLTMEEHSNGKLTGRFIGRISSDGFDGVWENADGSKTMDCTLYHIN